MRWDIPGITSQFKSWEESVKEKTKANVFRAFVGEAKAYFRLLAYAVPALDFMGQVGGVDL